ncbi:AMP-dependent synthetase/ligase [Leucobacter sp. USHLN153]|uniref:AMP-dependent synthetase/ligase n=1 Tax=Leucobacter sp. USHLN153 TaxID=3081268 RepID=UPI003FA56276
MNQSETPILVAPVPEDNITDLLEQRVAATPDRALFAVPEGEGWRDISASAFRADVIALAKGLAAAGIQPGDRIAFMCTTSYQWTLLDFAIHYAGAVMVPIYETSSPLQVHWVLEDSGARAIITESQEHAERFAEIRDDLPAVQLAWRLDEGALETLREQGAAVEDVEITRRRSLAVGSDVATLIYTSGSTGRPKGCVLTHSNFVDLSRNSGEALHQVVGQPGASTLLFVTLAHVFARFISVLAIHSGVRVGHEADTSQLLPALGSFKPTFLLAVPRVFEKVYNSAEQKTEAEGKGKIFRAAAKVAVEHSEALDAGKVPFLLGLKFKLFDKLVYSTLREKLGGNVRFAVSGSAPLSHYLAHFYRSLGVKILEGYGLTETTAPVTVNLPDKFKIGTVGPALPGHTIRIAEDGEIEVKGIDVFKEYWNNPEATQAAFTEDGFFRTGDVGKLDEDGYLSITGRKKEIIVTAGGKNVAPAALEDPIRSNTIVGQVVVVGDQKPFISALVTLDPEMLPVWLNNAGEDANMTLEEAAVHPKVLAEVQRAVDEGNRYVSRAESIRKFVILPTEFIEANGHLTPKMSIRRDNILRDFSREIAGIYGENPQTETVSVKPRG